MKLLREKKLHFPYLNQQIGRFCAFTNSKYFTSDVAKKHVCKEEFSYKTNVRTSILSLHYLKWRKKIKGRRFQKYIFTFYHSDWDAIEKISFSLISLHRFRSIFAEGFLKRIFGLTDSYKYFPMRQTQNHLNFCFYLFSNSVFCCRLLESELFRSCVKRNKQKKKKKKVLFIVIIYRIIKNRRLKKYF